MTALHKVEYPPKAKPTYEALEAEVLKLRAYKRAAKQHSRSLQACYERGLRFMTDNRDSEVNQLIRQRDSYRRSYENLFDVYVKQLAGTSYLDLGMGFALGVGVALVVVAVL